MIRGFFRLIGLRFWPADSSFMVYDGARFVADQTLRFTGLASLERYSPVPASRRSGPG